MKERILLFTSSLLVLGPVCKLAPCHPEYWRTVLLSPKKKGDAGPK